MLEFRRWAVQDAASPAVAEVASVTADASADASHKAGAERAPTLLGAPDADAGVETTDAAVVATREETAGESSSDQELTRVTLEADR
jgi:hypothetical protein